MNLEEMDRILEGCRRSAFRLETLPQYLVESEAASFEAWRAGKPEPARTPENSAWLAELQEIVARGIRWYRVRILDYPLADYSRFELGSYRESQAVGQETLVADRAEHLELADMHEDYWLFDDEIVARMVYDEEGHFIRPERITDTAKYLEMRETAMKCAEPLERYLARREPKLAE